jgi:molybdate-binding protein
MPEADGVIKQATRANNRADLVVFDKEEAAQKRIVLAGCDPATGLLSRMVEKISGVEIVSAAASSKLAVTWLSEGKVHIAGSHLEDPRTGEFNLPFIQKQFPDEDFTVVTFAQWEEGLVIGPGNPKRIRKVEDIARKNVRFVNREPGSGSRALWTSCWKRLAWRRAKSRDTIGSPTGTWPRPTW